MCDTRVVITPDGHGASYAVPCGKCPVCKQTRVNQWAFRLGKEDKISSSAYFVTLTYKPGEITLTENNFKTLVVADLQNFFKRLRYYDEPYTELVETGDDPPLPPLKIRKYSKIKYYAVGEYGSSKRMRPHYHIILFNVRDVSNIRKSWELGIVDIGNVSGASIKYVLKYMDKPAKVGKHKRDDRLKEFSLMSNGIGESYLTDEVVRYFNNNLERNYLTTREGYKVGLPRYYKNRIFGEEDKEKQRGLAQKAYEEKERKLRLKHSRLYGHTGFTFESYLHGMKVARFTKFYKNIKTRDQWQEKD